MTKAPRDAAAADTLPVARVRRRRPWLVYAVWLVPLLAAAAAGFLVYGWMRERGPTVTIMFRDATGIRPSQTEIRYRGVTVGDVAGLELSPDFTHVAVSARLRRNANVAREGSIFWIVRPEVGIETVRGLTTVITGPYIEVYPGSGGPKTEFVGVEQPSPTLGRKGLHLILATGQLASIRPRAAVYYRGIEVGMVSSTVLSRDSTAAQVHVLIEPRYARLVRLGSRFWSSSGLDVNLSLFKGVEINVESLRSLVAGGIVFATPDAASPPAKDGSVFVLHDQAEKEWLAWTTKIPLPGGD